MYVIVKIVTWYFGLPKKFVINVAKKHHGTNPRTKEF